LKDNDERLCKSRIWWPKIKNLAEKFEIALNSIGSKNSTFIQLDTKKLDESLEIYERGWWCFKEYVYGETAEEKRIDRHKIIALYILSFLIKRPFEIRVHPENKEADRRLFLANELFSLAVMRDLLSAWNENKLFGISANERKWLVILFNLFKLKFIKSNQLRISDDPSNVTDLLALSQIVYYIENAYS